MKSLTDLGLSSELAKKCETRRPWYFAFTISYFDCFFYRLLLIIIFHPEFRATSYYCKCCYNLVILLFQFTTASNFFISRLGLGRPGLILYHLKHTQGFSLALASLKYLVWFDWLIPFLHYYKPNWAKNKTIKKTCSHEHEVCLIVPSCIFISMKTIVEILWSNIPWLYKIQILILYSLEWCLFSQNNKQLRPEW